ncbi:hypothetical protein FJZ31_41085 [Candidatus Poribacteria bacterium]|nr:hypothetical protein [Candidatus Poribacteria bacterium]
MDNTMLIRELVYDTETDELDLLIDTFKSEPAKVIPIGNDIFLRRSIKNGKIVGATIANYSFWHPELLADNDLKPDNRLCNAATSEGLTVENPNNYP